MLITRKHPRAGRALSGYPICTDEETGRHGYKIGYCKRCTEPLLIENMDVRDFAHAWGGMSEEYYKMIRKLNSRRKHSFKTKMVMWAIKGMRREDKTYIKELKELQEVETY